MIALRKEKEVNGMYLSSHPLDEFKHEIKYFVKNELTDLANIENMVGYEVTFASIVTAVQHRVAQNGNGWGVFKIEDYSGDYEFRLFKESYLKFKHLLDLEQMIFIKARVQERFRNFGDRKEREVNLDIKEVMLLSSLFNEVNATAEIKVSLEHIDEEMIENLLSTMKKHKGKSRLRLKVMYASESLEVGLMPKSVKVNLTKDFVDDIFKIEHLNLVINQ
jgi:DNA polymerase-3 subunit alpha